MNVRVMNPASGIIMFTPDYLAFGTYSFGNLSITLYQERPRLVICIHCLNRL
jgi:hypothetical protein